MSFEFSFNGDAIKLTLQHEQTGLLGRIWNQKDRDHLESRSLKDRDLMFAIAELRAVSDGRPNAISISENEITLSHDIAAELDSTTASILGLPPLVDLVLKTDVEGIVGSSSFRLRYEWTKNGQRQTPQRVGCILKTAAGPKRIPLWLLDAVKVADNFDLNKEEASHWNALARFRQALDPGIQIAGPTQFARASMSDFLIGLEVSVADRFSIDPDLSLSDFNIVPFSADGLSRDGIDAESGEASVSNSELVGDGLRSFQRKVRERGALPAYRLAQARFLVIDKSAAPALEVISTMMHAPDDVRAAFIRNPRAKITEAYEETLRTSGQLDGLTPQAEEEAIEAAAGPAFVETIEFSERVTGVRKFEKSTLDLNSGSGTTWLPEVFAAAISTSLSKLDVHALTEVQKELSKAIENNVATVSVNGHELPATVQSLKAIESLIETKRDAENVSPGSDNVDRVSSAIVLETKENFEELTWHSQLKPRHSSMTSDIPKVIRTQLMQHQFESLHWQINAWKAGLPGVLNADEQGLGKTLQTISFLAWLKSHMAQNNARNRGPILVVAPTTLLENWEQEVHRHSQEPGLGHLIRLFGSATGARKLTGKSGRDIDDGQSKLDLAFLHDAVTEGRAHNFWLLTTYTTLTNYQHSLARIPFSAVVFDEIQALKNPDSMRAHAARAINADFRIGLTGTPIENSSIDLWAITDQLAPGSLSTLKAFKEQFGTPDENNMAELHSKVFKPVGDTPPLALRRLKEMVAKDLPEKSRKLHPSLMPQIQANAYEDARVKLANGGPGAALKMLHHIRTVSVHPYINGSASNIEFIGDSARLKSTFEILKTIAEQGEKALVFIEHIRMQHRFIALVKAEFKLDRVELINGSTPIMQRQAIVDRFQRHLNDDRGFDLLVLGPKAAGTGLTLTAATHVIHLSRWWNPAVEEQCNDRIHRLGQKKAVTIHIPMAVHPGYREHSFDCLLQSLMQRKRKLAASALWPMGDTDSDISALQKMLTEDRQEIGGDPLTSSIIATFKRDGLPNPVFAEDGSVRFE